MKKVFFLIFLTAFAGTTFSQQIPKEPNKQLRQLVKYLEEKGAEVRHQQTTMWGDGVTHTWSSDLYSVKKDRELVFDSICKTFNSLDKVASEFYHYECHAGKRDTTKYSLSFYRDADKTDCIKGDTCDNYKVYYETAHFSRYWGCRYFSHSFTTPTGIDWEDIHPFDTISFKEQIQPIIDSFMALKGAKAYPVYWRHEGGYDYKKYKDLISWSYSDEHKSQGLTTGTHYFIPLKHKEAVDALYKQLDSLTYNYVNNHPQQKYTYTFTKKFPGIHTGYPTTIVEGNCRPYAYIEEEDNYDHEYNLRFLQFEDGYHILSITTKGDIWIPYEWYKLKSWVNGERVYLKGMKPKPRDL